MNTGKPPSREQLRAAVNESAKHLPREVNERVYREYLAPRRPSRVYFGNFGNGRWLILNGHLYVTKYGVYLGDRKRGYSWPAGGPLRRLLPFRPKPTPVHY